MRVYTCDLAYAYMYARMCVQFVLLNQTHNSRKWIFGLTANQICFYHVPTDVRVRLGC